jgi:dTDP-4-amino-4,6-dideoxygalactose transaminase
MIRLVDLVAQNRAILDELTMALHQVVGHGRIILGSEVEQFEQRVAIRHGLPWAVGVHSGTAALMLAFEALGIGPGDEVITVSNSFVATVAAIVRVGATPVLVDVDDHQLLDTELLPAAITERTRAVVPVHLNGRPAAMDEIMEIARAHGVAVVEDCAQALGATWRGVATGGYGDLGCYSMHPLKNLGALGDAGVVVGRDFKLRETLRLLRNHGLRDRDACLRWGHNARLDTLQAAFLNVKLKYFDDMLTRRRQIAERYLRELVDLPLELPVLRAGEGPVWSGFVVQSDRRDDLRAALADVGVDSLIYYPVPIHLQPAAASLGYGQGSLPVAERQADRILSLPVHPELTDAQVEHVVLAVRAACAA